MSWFWRKFRFYLFIYLFFFISKLMFKNFQIRLDNLSQHKKWSFPLRISSVNVTKSSENCGFGHIYWRNPQRKTCAVYQQSWRKLMGQSKEKKQKWENSKNFDTYFSLIFNFYLLWLKSYFWKVDYLLYFFRDWNIQDGGSRKK